MKKTDSIPISILDTDLYKLTMQSVILKDFPTSKVSYVFINRSNHQHKLISMDCFQQIKLRINQLEFLQLTKQEKDWLEKSCPYFSISYLNYLSNFKFKPKDHIKISFIKQDEEIQGLGELEININGLWSETILYEIPIMSIISETYFQIMNSSWSIQDQLIHSQNKSITLINQGCKFVEFGTRRRRSYQTQQIVLQGLKNGTSQANQNAQGALIGTSNLHFAMKFDLNPIGTIAHEFVMGIAALYGYNQANLIALDLWEKSFQNHSNLLVAITDTFTSGAFFRELESDPDRVNRWNGLRQDSGDPKEFVKLAKEIWIKLGIDPKSKLIVFSDGLDVEKCLELHQFCKEEGVNESYGIGTHLTNDFQQLDQNGKVIGHSNPLNIVIKLSSIDDHPCVKLSDDLSKTIGPPETIKMVKECLGLP